MNEDDLAEKYWLEKEKAKKWEKAMSMAKCKCDKIIDTDEELEYDSEGNSCCDMCYEEILKELEKDIADCSDLVLAIIIEDLAEKLAIKGYRKIR